MSLRADRNAISESVLQGKFIEQTLKKHGETINIEIGKRQASAGFRSAFWSKRNFATKGNTMVYTHLKQHRFIDMRTRKTKSGTKKKKNYPHHNRILYGQANNLVRELAYGFVTAIKEEMAQLIEKKKL